MKQTMVRGLTAISTILALAIITACAEPTPDVTPPPQELSEATEDSEQAIEEVEDSDESPGAESEETTEETTEEPAEEPEGPTVGSREAPLALGETRKLTEASAWTVGIIESNLDAEEALLAADPYHDQASEDERFLLATVSVTVDAAAIEAQGHDMSDGAEPGFSVFIEFIGSDGRTYDEGSGSMCFTDEMFYSVGAVYDDGTTVTGNVCISAPEDVIGGGLWRISNFDNDAVWVQTS